MAAVIPITCWHMCVCVVVVAVVVAVVVTNVVVGITAVVGRLTVCCWWVCLKWGR